MSPFLKSRESDAIEFDFGNNWAEAMGQSAYYDIQTGKKVGIFLILQAIKDRKYWIRLNTTIEHFNLPLIPGAYGIQQHMSDMSFSGLSRLPGALN